MKIRQLAPFYWLVVTRTCVQATPTPSLPRGYERRAESGSLTSGHVLYIRGMSHTPGRYIHPQVSTSTERMCQRALVLLGVVAVGVMALPQDYSRGGGRGKQLQQQQQQQQQQQHMPWDYNFKWQVDSEEYRNYYGQQETGLDNRVDGSYYVLLPDNRLMRVTYYVDGNSGFVPTITYEDNYTPAWGTPGFLRR